MRILLTRYLPATYKSTFLTAKRSNHFGTQASGLSDCFASPFATGELLSGSGIAMTVRAALLAFGGVIHVRIWAAFGLLTFCSE